MPDDVSLLPEQRRTSEEEPKKELQRPPADEKLKMYVPRTEQEDVEVIEVDEGDVNEVLEGEPLLSRMIFKAQSWFQDAKAGTHQSRANAAPAKTPPPFFKPPAPLTKTVSPDTATKTRIMPQATAPRRVRVIRRIRKPVRVSFIEDADASSRVDVSRRRFTLVFVAILFCALFAGSYVLLRLQGDRARMNLDEVTRRLSGTQSASRSRLDNWQMYRDLEPRLKALSGLLDRHLSPSRVFDALEARTVPDVSYSSFTLSPDGRLVLGTTAPSFESAARQIVSFESSGIASAVQAMGYQARYTPETGALEAVNFQMSLQLNPSVLRASVPQTTATR
jgi:hypothetical protein